LGALGERMVEAGQIEWAAELRPRFQSDREWARLLHDIAYAHARAGRIGEAHAITAQIEDPEYRAGVTLGIASILARAGRTGEALAIAAQIRREGRLEERHLAYLAVVTVAAGKPSEGLEIARGLTSPGQISRVYLAIGSRQASRGQLRDALDTAEHLTVPLHRALLMSDIALAEARAGNHDAALHRALMIERADQRVEAIAKIALLLMEKHEED